MKNADQREVRAQVDPSFLPHPLRKSCLDLATTCFNEILYRSLWEKQFIIIWVAISPSSAQLLHRDPSH